MHHRGTEGTKQEENGVEGMKDFHELEVWRRAHELNRFVYALVKTYPGLVEHGLAPPMRRASIAIASNIAEGCGGSGNSGAERWYFNAAMGEASALEYLVLLAYELRLIPYDRTEWFTGMAVEIQRMLLSMLKEKTTESRAPASLTLVQ